MARLDPKEEELHQAFKKLKQQGAGRSKVTVVWEGGVRSFDIRPADEKKELTDRHAGR